MADNGNLTAVLLGGALALAGTVISQVFGLLSGWVERRHERDVRRREKLEQMTEAVSATLPWFQSLSRKYFGSALTTPLQKKRKHIFMHKRPNQSLEPTAGRCNEKVEG